ncbi:hypothetical protein TWF694_003516 [Orbilia ellipsospora]|uniref:CCR4-NOT transcription complex subunit 11 n=1 Tax=Orbilia ellipsospora TaxID=2528407 RepID=A0AAV9WZN6_9PEZI
MASYSQLPDELRRLLETVTSPFASTATKFLDAIPNPEQHFTRACEILITLIATATPNSTPATSEWRPMEKNIGFRLNATFTLYWLYREYDVLLNPFRSHFVETCEAEKARMGNLGPGERDTAGERLRRARLKMLLAILGGEGSKLADLSAKDFYGTFEQMRLGESADLRTFAEEEGPPVQAWHTTTTTTTREHQQQSQKSTNGYHANGGGRKTAGGTPSPAPVGQTKQPVFAQSFPHPHPQSYPVSSGTSIITRKDQANASSSAFTEETATPPPPSQSPYDNNGGSAVSNDIIEDALSNAHVRHLNSKERNMLLGNIIQAGRIYHASDPEAYRRMLDLNFDLLQSLTVEILRKSSTSTSTNANRDTKRQALLNAVLPKLNLELRSLDLINHLVVRPATDEPNATLLAPADSKTVPIMTVSERTHLLHVFISNCILQLEAPYGNHDDGIPLTTRRGKGPDVARKVKLLCMFITNLLTREVVNSGELYFEMQNIYMGFTTFREARELWTNATGGRGVGVGLGVGFVNM